MSTKLPRSSKVVPILRSLMNQGMTDKEIIQKCFGKEYQRRFYELRKRSTAGLTGSLRFLRGMDKAKK